MIAFAAVIALQFAIPVLDEGAVNFDLRTLYTVIVGTLITAVVIGGGPIPRFLSARPLVFVGRVSYGVYLVHNLCISAAYRLLPAHSGAAAITPRSVVTYLVACTIAVGVAFALAVAIERPLISVGRQWSKAAANR